MLSSSARWLLVLCLLLVVGLVIPPSDRGATAQSPTSAFGVNAHVASRFGVFGQRDAPLDVLADHQVTWVREEFQWHQIEPSPGQFDWGPTEETVDKAARRGINVLGLLAYSVGWASGRPGSRQPVRAMPQDLDAYRNYVSATVTKFRGRVRAWEVWNEPNLDLFWQPRPDPRQYARLLTIAAQAIRSADPAARVVLGGVSGSDIAFLEQVVDLAGWDAFDILAAHSYVGSPNPFVAKNAADSGLRSPERGYQADGDVAKLAAFVARHGGNKRIWLTEIGWSTAPMSSGSYAIGSDEIQANHLVRGSVQSLAASPLVERIFWYTWNNDGPDRGNMEQNFGLVDTWRKPKPAAGAFRTLAQRLSGATAPRRLDLTPAGRRVITSFERFDGVEAWRATALADPAAGNSARIERSTERQVSGTASARITFRLGNLSPTGQAWVFPWLETSLPISGQPRRLGLSLYGDSAGHLLWAVLRDARDLEFQVLLGAISPGGWQLRQAELADFADRIEYPLRFLGFRIDNEPDGAAGSGVIDVDDLFVEEGPAAYGYRFDRAGAHVDVLWSTGGSMSVNLPTASREARVTSRDGQSRSVSASGGTLALTLDDAPIFVEHTGRAAEPPPAAPLPPAPGAPQPPVDLPNNKAMASPAFERRWAASDQGAAGRTFVYGPAPFTDGLREPYANAPGGQRLVQYFDKARMELNDPATGVVTAGLLTKELISGRQQDGDDVFVPRGPARVPVAGDPDNPFPLYADLAGWSERAPVRTGQWATERALPGGQRGSDANATGDPQAELTAYDEATGHNVPRAFANFRDNPAYGGLLSIGWAITEPVWAEVRVAGTPRRVLIQAFERRVLTYTPDNTADFRVEFGNIGRHYYGWRYLS